MNFIIFDNIIQKRVPPLRWDKIADLEKKSALNSFGNNDYCEFHQSWYLNQNDIDKIIIFTIYQFVFLKLYYIYWFLKFFEEIFELHPKYLS
jgi:hypothetical protein